MRHILLTSVVLGFLSSASCTETIHLRFVEVGGHRFRIQGAGLQNVNKLHPLVVFEAGAGEGVETWGPVLKSVSSLAPVLAYERSGLGRSEWDEQRPTPKHVSENLH